MFVIQLVNMNQKLLVFQNAEKQHWNTFIDSTPYSTILQFWQWGEVKKSEGWQPSRLAYFENEEIRIAAQVLIKSAPMLGNYLYVPYGPVFRSRDDLQKCLQQFLTGLRNFASENNCFLIEFDPLIGELVEQEESPEALLPYLDKQIKKILEENGFQISERNFQPRYKLFYDLTKSEEELMMQMKKNTRYNVRLAEKKGVEIEITKMSSPEAKQKVDQFYELLLETQKRAEGYPIRPKSTFERLLSEFENLDNLEIFTASYQGDVIAMNISEFTNYWASSFYGASNRLHPEVKAAYLLRWKSVQRAKEKGCKVYDFWGIVPNSKQHQGYSEAKLSFGGTRMDTYGLFALPLSSWKYQVWDKLLPLRAKIFSKG